MKRNNPFGLWQRCRVCGTVFQDRAELRAHQETHAAQQPETDTEQPPADILWDEPQDAIDFSKVSQPSRVQQPAHGKKFLRRKPQQPPAHTVPFS